MLTQGLVVSKRVTQGAEMIRWLGIVFGMLALFPARSLASPTYPVVLQRSLGLACPPTCLVCHTQVEGGPATANTRVGVTLRRMFDAECCDDHALLGVIEQLEAADVDSDDDGISDVAELQLSSDPNQASNDQPLACTPKGKSAGCTLRPVPGGGGLGAWVGLAWLLLNLFSARRWRKHAPRTSFG